MSKPRPSSTAAKQFGLFEAKDRIDLDYRKVEKIRFERHVAEALVNSPSSAPLAVTRLSIVRSFVFMYIEKHGYKTEEFLKRRLAILAGRSLSEMLELEHTWREVHEWMKEVRLHPEECYLVEEFR